MSLKVLVHLELVFGFVSQRHPLTFCSSHWDYQTFLHNLLNVLTFCLSSLFFVYKMSFVSTLFSLKREFCILLQTLGTNNIFKIMHYVLTLYPFLAKTALLLNICEGFFFNLNILFWFHLAGFKRHIPSGLWLTALKLFFNNLLLF